MSENFYFACIPRYLRVEHSFAKGIKQNTKYRIMIFKGIQKCDQMKQAIRSKIVGGKIDLESPQLFFNVSFYNPTKNIQFTIKIYEQKPNEDETQIGSFVIMSSDYIKSFKTENKEWHQIEGMIKDDLFCTFDLLVEKSKFALLDAVKRIISPISKGGKQVDDDIKSQSSVSRQDIRNGEGFISPRKRIQRKNSGLRKLKSRNNNRSEDEQSDDDSVTSSNRKWRKFAPSERQEKFLQSPKRFTSTEFTEVEKSQVTKSHIISPSYQNHLTRTVPVSPRSPTELQTVDNSYLPINSKQLTQPAQEIVKTTVPSVKQTEFQFQSAQEVFDVRKEDKSEKQIPAQPEQKTEQKAQYKKQKPKSEEQKSEKTEKSILLRERQVKWDKSQRVETQKIALGSRLIESSKENTELSGGKDKLTTDRRNKIIYTIFLIVSVYLIYRAMIPTRRT